MMVDIERIKNGIMEYANTDVIPKLPVKKQFLAGLAVGLVTSRADRILERFSGNQTVQAMGLIDGRMVDIEAVYNVAKEQIHRTPTLQVDLPFIGTMRFGEADIDALYKAIGRVQ